MGRSSVAEAIKAAPKGACLGTKCQVNVVRVVMLGWVIGKVIDFYC